MKKIIIIVIIVIVIAAIAGVIFYMQAGNSGNSNPTTGGSTGALPPVAIESSTYNPPTGDKLTIGTPEGGVLVNNFYNNAQQVSEDHSSILLQEAGSYSISYYAPDSSFGILIEQTPFATVRTQAEAAFLEALGVSKTDACKLTVMVAVPYSVDPIDSTQNFGLSFCSGGAFRTNPGN